MDERTFINNQKMIDFINSYYDNHNTRNANLNMQKKAPPYTTTTLLNGQFFEEIKDLKYKNKILHPMSRYIEHTKLDKDYKQFFELRRRMSGIIHYANQEYSDRARKKTENPATVKVREIEEVFDRFYDDAFNETFHGYTKVKSEIEEHNIAIIAGFYGYITGFRDNLGDVSFNKRDDKNYIDVKNGKFYLNEYKTSHYNGSKEYEIPEKVLKYIRYTLIQNPREHLIVNPKTNKIYGDYARLSSIIHVAFLKTIGRKFGINDIRKAWVTESLDKPLDHRLELANRMGHTLNTSYNIYRRIG